MAEAHAVLEGALVVGFGSLGLDVLLNRVDLGLVLNEFLLDVVEPVVDVALEYLVLFGVVLHRVVRHLLLQAGLVLGEECADVGEADLFAVEVDLEVVGARELVGHLVLHLGDLLGDLLHLLLDAALERLDLLEVTLPLLELDLESRVRGLRILDLALLEGQLLLLVLELRRRRQVVLTHHRLLHVLQQQRYRRLVLVYLTLVCGFFFFEALHELVDLALLLVEDLVLLGLTVFSARTLTPAGFLLLQVLLYLLYVTLVRFDHFADISNILLELFDLSVVLLDPVEEAFARLRER